MLTAINYLAIVAIGGAYYLLITRFAPDVPFGLGLAAAAAAGLIMCLTNYLALTRKTRERATKLRVHAWWYFLLVFAVTAGLILSISQIVLARSLPSGRVSSNFILLALNLLILGLSSFVADQRHRTEQPAPRPES